MTVDEIIMVLHGYYGDKFDTINYNETTINYGMQFDEDILLNTISIRIVDDPDSVMRITRYEIFKIHGELVDIEIHFKNKIELLIPYTNEIEEMTFGLDQVDLLIEAIDRILQQHSGENVSHGA